MQLIVSFFAVMLPVIAFLIANNWYAKNVVREKVSETYRSTLDIFISQTDRQLKEIDDYLYKMSFMDLDAALLLSSPAGSDEYVLTKVRIKNKLDRDRGFYNLIDTIFLFHKNDIILSTYDLSYGNTRKIIENNIAKIIEREQPVASEGWMLLKDDLMQGTDFLVRITEVMEGSGLYAGVIIKVSDILGMLSIMWEDNAIGESAVYRRNGIRLAESLSDKEPSVPLTDLILNNVAYQTVTGESDGRKYLVMNRSSTMADMTVSLIIPESDMMKGLTYFQKAAYFIVAGIIVIFMLYLYFIRRMLFKPLQQLIAGMKKISHGMLDVRLKTNETVEFIFLATTFNSMAEQIKTLKIGMYEEQLRGQKIELMQLQAQINPHFYMNSLNIMYNFAALKDHDSIKKMALYMADYFRFIMGVNRDLISLEEELKHIRNYIEIQKFRFPNRLECELDIPEPILSLPLPALLLQPFVENAIIHGFVNRRKPFRIVIAGRLSLIQDVYYLTVTIQDNGVGFSEEILERLNKGEALPPSETSRLGILNVIQRLKLRYNGEADISFHKPTGQEGAAVSIRLPLAGLMQGQGADTLKAERLEAE
ncbi:sensor histidine kinase [Paenibacillus tarimensis]